ncbi:Homeodomain transcription factor [Mycena venus]|uniref:Homeodomain transcription factor n=1 Tax=Mycena venus TaxID=2733690 RepID=A0A8H6TX87_9AGAR|nr:Homeodomain transcription factor [Mycena venus]
MPPLKSSLDKVKKPRHRHSAVQLAALNSLYEQTEHPSLAQRTALAQSLGLGPPQRSSHEAALTTPHNGPPLSPLPYSAVDDDYYYPPTELPVHNQQFRSALHLDQDPRPRNQLSSPIDRSRFISEPHAMDSGPPSRLQIDQLQRIYRINAYPTLDESRAIAERLGMRYQTIVEWFRTQRNLDNLRRSIDDYPTTAASDSIISPISEASEMHSRAYPILPPISTLPPPTSHPSLVGLDGARRLSAITVPEDQYYAAAPTNRSTALSLSARQRRGRPDPFQLNSLRRLLSKTPTPSIEERSALALEIGMDLGKVTNWFRNLRQSARKREKKQRRPGASDDGDDFEPVYLSSTSRSRSETPMSSVERDMDPEYVRERHVGRHGPVHSSDEEEDAQEAVTPSTSPSPAASPARRRLPDLLLEEKPAAMASGSVPYEDALLLLSFHRRAGMV